MVSAYFARYSRKTRPWRATSAGAGLTLATSPAKNWALLFSLAILGAPGCGEGHAESCGIFSFADPAGESAYRPPTCASRMRPMLPYLFAINSRN
jgi:hypothetical protein